MDNLPKNFCIMPFSHMNIRLSEGSVGACWRYSKNLGDYDKQTLDEIWNSDEYQKIRSNFLSNKFGSGCNSCIDYETKGMESTRTRCNANFEGKYGSLIDYVNSNFINTEAVKKPLSIEIRFGNLCNLRCLHCSSLFSSKWDTAVKNNDWLKDINHHFKNTSTNNIPKSIVNEIREISANLDHINITGGEPLIHPNHIPFLKQIENDAHHIHIEYNTNFNIDRKKLDEYMKLWSSFKKLTLRISLDASKNIYSYFRTFGNYDLVRNNIEYFKSNYTANNVDLCITITTNIYNITKIEDCFKEIKYDFGCRFHASLVQHPTSINIINLPKELKHLANEQLSNILPLGNSGEQHFILMIQNYLNSANNNLEIFNNDTINFILGMDKLNNVNYRNYYPEFIKYMGSI